MEKEPPPIQHTHTHLLYMPVDEKKWRVWADSQLGLTLKLDIMKITSDNIDSGKQPFAVDFLYLILVLQG